MDTPRVTVVLSTKTATGVDVYTDVIADPITFFTTYNGSINPQKYTVDVNNQIIDGGLSTSSLKDTYNTLVTPITPQTGTGKCRKRRKHKTRKLNR
jgi:hypothetical protein